MAALRFVFLLSIKLSLKAGKMFDTIRKYDKIKKKKS